MVESSSGAEVKFHEMGAGFPPVISRGIFSRLGHFLGRRSWGRIIILDFACVSQKVLSGLRLLSHENEEISTPPPCGFLIGIYKFYKNWSTETLRRE
jgi:hypothetical protein